MASRACRAGQVHIDSDDESDRMQVSINARGMSTLLVLLSHFPLWGRQVLLGFTCFSRESLTARASEKDNCEVELDIFLREDKQKSFFRTRVIRGH